MTAEQGYLILAVDTADVCYRDCAVELAHSMREFHPDSKICLLSDCPQNDPVFDYEVSLPFGNQGGWANDWQCWHASPFRETVKLEADMIVTSPVDHWWPLFRLKDVVLSTGVRDFYDNTSHNRYYRKVFDANDLPDVYNAITYWRKSETARDFWNLTRSIFTDWSKWRTMLKFADEHASTDLVYAMAAQIIGAEKVTLPRELSPQMVHMKRRILDICEEDWTKELIWERQPDWLRINTITQWGLFHYHIKNWCKHE